MGLCVGSFSPCRSTRLVAFLRGQQSSSWPRIEATGHYCVNILAEDQEVARVFAGKADDKFAGIGWRLSPLPAPPC